MIRRGVMKTFSPSRFDSGVRSAERMMQSPAFEVRPVFTPSPIELGGWMTAQSTPADFISASASSIE